MTTHAPLDRPFIMASDVPDETTWSVEKRLARRGITHWRYRRRAHVLWYTGRPYYEVDLERCRTSAEVLDWIVQVSHKIWASPAAVAQLVVALDMACDLQATRCGGGIEGGPWARLS